MGWIELDSAMNSGAEWVVTFGGCSVGRGRDRTRVSVEKMQTPYIVIRNVIIPLIFSTSPCALRSVVRKYRKLKLSLSYSLKIKGPVDRSP